MRKLLLFLALVAAVSPAVAGSIPTEGLAPYEPYRATLVAHGWQPETLPNAYIDGMPEVLCGSGLCTASWQSPEGDLVDFTLWRGDDAEVLLLAPETD